MVPVCAVMPCFVNAFCSSAETASSSSGTRRGSSSTIVTFVPKRLKIDAELHADGAAAEDHHRLRHLLQVDRLVARDDAPPVDLDAGHAARL